MDPPAHLLERIRTIFPALRLSSVRLDPDGLVNTVVIVNDEWVCRFAKDEHGRQALAHEGSAPRGPQNVRRFRRDVGRHAAEPVLHWRDRTASRGT